ncbi:MAG: efflux RND transporter periplasmic adaptor subunit, partial [Butyricimonas faecihominis]
NLSYTQVSSPADGVIGKIPYRVGSLVSPSMTTPLTTVSDNSKMFVYFSMNEKDLLKLTRQSNGATQGALNQMPAVELQLIDGSIYSEKGKIETLSGVIDQTTGSASVRATFLTRTGSCVAVDQELSCCRRNQTTRSLFPKRQLRKSKIRNSLSL